MNPETVANLKFVIENYKKIPITEWKYDEFGHRVVWFLDRQKPSVEADYSFDEERLGIRDNGNLVFGFCSGCSCPSPWSPGDYSDDIYQEKTWKQCEIDADKAFDIEWEKEVNDAIKALTQRMNGN